MNRHSMTWLAADYHLPATYSLRIPMSSMQSARAMPAPAPATVRLALIRNAIELYGLDYTRDDLFPVIRSAQVRVRPPERVALSTQLIRGYKASTATSARGERLDESPIYREYAHARGVMTVFVQIPDEQADVFREVLRAIGYWGRADSLAYCVAIAHAVPQENECATPLSHLRARLPIRRFFCCLLSEFRDGLVAWNEVVPDLDREDTDAVRPNLYVWPMVVVEQHRGGTQLLRRSLESAEMVSVGKSPVRAEN